MTFQRRASLALAALLVASCTHRPAPATASVPAFRWTKAGASSDQFERDLSACQTAASEMEGKALPDEAVHRINVCLEAKGYHRLSTQ